MFSQHLLKEKNPRPGSQQNTAMYTVNCMGTLMTNLRPSIKSSLPVTSLYPLFHSRDKFFQALSYCKQQKAVHGLEMRLGPSNSPVFDCLQNTKE